MDIKKESIKKDIREMINLGYIVPDDIPDIELYMDQVTTFMDTHLSKNKRRDDDKTLTKTMINNYTKNELLPPPEKKRYSKEHIILLIYIYYLKNVISISDIQTMLNPLIDEYYNNPNASHSLDEIYTSLYNLEKYQYFNTENSIIKSYECAEKDFNDKKDGYLKDLTFLSLLAYDIYTKKSLMEHIIDKMAKEQEEKSLAEEKNEEAKKKTRRQKDEREAKSNQRRTTGNK